MMTIPVIISKVVAYFKAIYPLGVVQNGSGAHPAYLMGTGGSFPGVKRPGCETDHSQLVPRSRIHGSIHPLPHTSSWRNG
jgi:hypothetical protein